MIRLFLILILLNYKSLCAYAQLSHNLVPNPSFENCISCPIKKGDFYKVSNWFSKQCYSSPDYFNACSPNNQLQTNNVNWAGYQEPHTGIAYSGLFFEYADYEYIACKLTNSLIPGKKYCLGFYSSLADSAYYALDLLSLVVSDDTLICPPNPNSGIIWPVTIGNISGSCLMDTQKWTSINGTFIASGNEKFITIGVFAEDADITYCMLTPWLWPRSYYFIDDYFVYTFSGSLYQATS